MQPPAYREIIRRLLKEGFCERASKGDHRRFCKGAMRVTVRARAINTQRGVNGQALKSKPVGAKENKMKLAAEVVVLKEKDGWTAIIPQYGDAATSAQTKEGALAGAKEILELEAGDLIHESLSAPKMQHVAEVVPVSVNVSKQDAKQMEYVEKSKAAEWLEVLQGRINTLVKNDLLKTKFFGKRELVSIDSINKYRELNRLGGIKFSNSEPKERLLSVS